MRQSLQPLVRPVQIDTQEDPSRVVANAPQLNATSRRLIIDSLSMNSTRAVKADLKVFSDWGGQLPADETEIANFLSDQIQSAGKKYSTVKRYANSLHLWHQMHGLASPVKGTYVRRVLKGMARTQDTRANSAPALIPEHLRQLLSAISLEDVRDYRNYTMFCLAFFGAFRRGELVRLRIDDVIFVDQGMELYIRDSKTNRSGRTETKPIIALPNTPELCPVYQLRRYIDMSGITRGAIFRSVSPKGRQGAGALSDNSFYRILKDALDQSGLSQQGYSPHSFRAGFITEAHRQGKRHHDIKKVSGHRDQKSFERYIREADAFDNHAGALDL